jgi:hypothetical protein
VRGAHRSTAEAPTNNNQRSKRSPSPSILFPEEEENSAYHYSLESRNPPKVLSSVLQHHPVRKSPSPVPPFSVEDTPHQKKSSQKKTTSSFLTTFNSNNTNSSSKQQPVAKAAQTPTSLPEHLPLPPVKHTSAEMPKSSAYSRTSSATSRNKNNNHGSGAKKLSNITTENNNGTYYYDDDEAVATSEYYDATTPKYRLGTPRASAGAASTGSSYSGSSSNNSHDETALIASSTSASEYILEKVTDEISGSCQDTLMSVDQVLSAFCLSGRDIDAVTKRVDRAKRQYNQGHRY